MKSNFNCNNEEKLGFRLKSFFSELEKIKTQELPSDFIKKHGLKYIKEDYYKHIIVKGENIDFRSLQITPNTSSQNFHTLLIPISQICNLTYNDNVISIESSSKLELHFKPNNFIE